MTHPKYHRPRDCTCSRVHVHRDVRNLTDLMGTPLPPGPLRIPAPGCPVHDPEVETEETT